MKIVINTCFGGFSLSEKACELLGIPVIELRKPLRNDPKLIEVVEQLGDKANGANARLNIVEIPDDVDWIIQEYDGVEWVAEKHRTWG